MIDWPVRLCKSNKLTKIRQKIILKIRKLTDTTTHIVVVGSRVVVDDCLVLMLTDSAHFIVKAGRAQGGGHGRTHL